MPTTGDWIIGGLGFVAAVAGLVGLAVRRRQVLVDALTEYVRSHREDAPAPSTSETEQETE